jgi:hypothetical protein
MKKQNILFFYPNQGTDFTPLRKKDGKENLTFVPFFLPKRIQAKLHSQKRDDSHDSIIAELKKFWLEKKYIKALYPEFQYFVMFTGSLTSYDPVHYNSKEKEWRKWAKVTNEFLTYMDINWKLDLDKTTKLDKNYFIIK